MDKYLENGKQIFDEYCSTADRNQPTMLPRAPEQTYIDKYPEDDQPAGPSFRDDRQHQSDYETEVKMYRTAELGLDENYTIFHSFKYTHHQYRLCVGTEGHIRKGCSKCKGKNAEQLEGECDFVIICADSFIVIEVKNMKNVGEVVECEPDFHLCSVGEDWQPECNREQQLRAAEREQQLRALNGTFQKSIKQRNKVVDLIRCIDQDANILQFTAYPNFSKQFKEQFQLSEMTESRLSDDELSTVIFEEDMSNTNFAAWWAENVTQAISSVRRAFKETLSISTEMPISGYNQDSHEKARNMLLAIWVTEKNTCKKSKCSLGQCIMDVNKQLKEGQITFEPKKGKNRDKNPDVVDAPDVISKYVGVLNLTTQQNDVFNSSEKLLWINGPAGAGKTVILCGKIIQLIQSGSDNKVVVFKFVGHGNNSQHYQHALDKASIEYELISTSKDDHTSAQLADLITESSVIIVEITNPFESLTLLIDILSVLSGYNLFVDDIQSVFNYNKKAEICTVLINKLLELSADKTVWIACDFVQAVAVLDKDTISIVANDSGVTLLCAAPLLIEICRPYPEKFFPLKQKWYPKYFFHVDRTLNSTGQYTNKAIFP